MTIVDFPAKAAVKSAPSNIDAEHALLGCVLFDNEALHRLESPLPASAFHEPFHARLWAAMVDAIHAGRLAEPIALMERFKADADFIGLGGLRFLADLVDHSPAGATAPHYAKTIADLALRRELIRLCGDVSARATADSEGTAFDVLADMERAASEIAHGGSQGSAWVSAGSITTAALSEARERNGAIGLSTGLHDLDRSIGGLRKGQLIIVAGRPSMGKSTAALQIAKGVARKGRGVIFFSLEMPAFDLGLRMACDVAHDPLAVQYQGRSVNPCYFDAARAKLTEEQWWKLDQAREDIAAWPLDFDVRPGLTVSLMQALARRKLRAWERAGIEPGCIIVDHLTIAKAEQDRRGNKVAEVGDISRGLAEMAKILDVPVVALCQLSREVDKRDHKDRRPQMSDLRWSGEIEQDARIITFLYRPEYYVRPPEDATDLEAETEYRAKLEKTKGKLFWLIEKNNNGPTGQVETYCDIRCSAIRDRLGGAA